MRRHILRLLAIAAATLLPGFTPGDAAAMDCARPADYLAQGIASLRSCRSRPANDFAASACLDTKPGEIPEALRKRLCESLDRDLKLVHGGRNSLPMANAVARTVQIVTTVSWSVIRMQDLAGGYARGDTENIVRLNLGPESMIHALSTEAARKQVQAARFTQDGQYKPDLREAIDAGLQRFAYVVDEAVTTEDATWTWSAILRVETDRRPDQWVRAQLKGRFAAAYVGDANLAGIVIEDFSETPAAPGAKAGSNSGGR